MSERYGSPGELQEMLEGFEDWIVTELDDAKAELQRLDGLGDPRYTAGRQQALRDVLDYIVVNR